MFALSGRFLAVVLLLLAGVVPTVQANVFDTIELNQIRKKLHGQVLDFTANHGKNARVYSPSLKQCRDVYVYLPPCYDPSLKYPVIFFLHGFAQDERSFYLLLPDLDEAIRSGRMPGTIVVAVDGSIPGRPSVFRPASFYVNSHAGDFEDYLMQDMWKWAHETFALRPEREAHVLAGVSMGGGAAFDLGIRHRDRVGVVAGIFPPLNLRWVDGKDRYMKNFDPNNWGWRTHLNHRWEVIASYFGGLVKVHIGVFVDPLYGFGDHAVQHLSEHNPIEHIDRLGLKNGELAMFVAYARRDEFNIDAQVESFLYVARERNLKITVHCDPNGRHNTRTALRLAPGTLDWIGQQLQKYGPTR